MERETGKSRKGPPPPPPPTQKERKTGETEGRRRASKRALPGVRQGKSRGPGRDTEPRSGAGPLARSPSCLRPQRPRVPTALPAAPAGLGSSLRAGGAIPASACKGRREAGGGVKGDAAERSAEGWPWALAQEGRALWTLRAECVLPALAGRPWAGGGNSLGLSLAVFKMEWRPRWSLESSILHILSEQGGLIDVVKGLGLQNLVYPSAHRGPSWRPELQQPLEE